jgi:ribosomal protein S18 acetylase RimI-like enzyme
MSRLTVRELSQVDLPQVVAIHVEAFPNSAITSLGPEAIRRYYSWILDGPHDAKLTGAWIGTTLVGFCAAGVFRGAMNGFLRANRRYLAMQIARHPRLLLSPLIRDRLQLAARVTLRFSGLARARPPAGPSSPPSFGILSIATARRARGAGAGRALMAEAEARARTHGFRTMNLTVHPDNQRALQFYENLGWTRRHENGVWRGGMQRLL